MKTNVSVPLWRTTAILIARFIFAGLFIMAASFKFLDMDSTATQIASAGFPFPVLLGWVAAVFESALAVCFLTGAFFSRHASLLQHMFVSWPLPFTVRHAGVEIRLSLAFLSTTLPLSPDCCSLLSMVPAEL